MTPHTRPGGQRPALRRVAPTVVLVGVLAGAVGAATHGPQGHDAPLRFTASGSTAPVGNGTSNGNTDPATGCNANGNCVKSFGVSVSPVGGLWPGRTVNLPVKYTNPYSFGIRVTQATVSVPRVAGPNQTSGANSCVTGHIIVGPDTRTFPVAPNGSTNVEIPMSLSSDAPDACKSATWKLTVTAQAVK